MDVNFFHKVYAIVRQIPEGKVSTYGAIGKYLGSAKSARMVGWALNKCPSDVPAHRVVNQKGLLIGKIHFQGITLYCITTLLWTVVCGLSSSFSQKINLTSKY